MKNSMLISDWDFKTHVADKFSLVPSLIPETQNIGKEDLKTRQEVLKLLKMKQSDRVSVILDFSAFFLPTGVFQRIVCLFMMMLKPQGKAASTAENGFFEAPVIANDYAWLSFKPKKPSSVAKQKPDAQQEPFDTVVLLSNFEKDAIKIEVDDQKYAKLLLQVVSSLVKKIKSEVMGGKLSIKLLLSSISSKNGPEDRKVIYLAEEDARAAKECTYWFKNVTPNTKSAAYTIAPDFNFDQLT